MILTTNLSIFIEVNLFAFLLFFFSKHKNFQSLLLNSEDAVNILKTFQIKIHFTYKHMQEIRV